MSKIFYKLNIDIDLEKAREYYQILEKEFQHKRWDVELDNVTISGWSIHGVNGKSGNFPLYEKEGEPWGIENYFETELAFGWAKDMLELFPYGYRAGVGKSPPGTIVAPHTDECGNYAFRLHIPIYTNEKYLWTTSEGTFHMPAGSVYMVDTFFMHSTRNDGNESRVHFGIAIPKTYIKDLQSFIIE